MLLKVFQTLPRASLSSIWQVEIYPKSKRKLPALEHRGLLCRYLRSPNPSIPETYLQNSNVLSTCCPSEYSPTPPPSETTAAAQATIRRGTRNPRPHTKPGPSNQATLQAFFTFMALYMAYSAIAINPSLPDPRSLTQALRQPDAKTLGSSIRRFR